MPEFGPLAFYGVQWWHLPARLLTQYPRCDLMTPHNESFLSGAHGPPACPSVTRRRRVRTPPQLGHSSSSGPTQVPELFCGPTLNSPNGTLTNLPEKETIEDSSVLNTITFFNICSASGPLGLLGNIRKEESYRYYRNKDVEWCRPK